MESSVLEIKGLSTSFLSDKGWISVINEIDFQVKPKEVLGVVGESGCGKSVTSLSIHHGSPSYWKLFCKRRNLV